MATFLALLKAHQKQFFTLKQTVPILSVFKLDVHCSARVSHNLIFSLINVQSFFLLACNMNCHKKCQSKVPNDCGINQKMLAEAMANAKVSI